MNKNRDRSMFAKESAKRKDKRVANYVTNRAVTKAVRKINRIPYPDVKHHTPGPLILPNGQLALSYILNLIPQGITENDRIGNDFIMTSLTGKILLEYTAANITLPVFWRWAIYYCPDAINGASYGDIYNANIVEAVRSIPNFRKVVLLKQGLHVVEPYNRCKIIPINLKFKKGLRVRNNNAVPAAVTDFNYGCLLFTFYCSSTTVVSQIIFQHRVSYTDS